MGEHIAGSSGTAAARRRVAVLVVVALAVVLLLAACGDSDDSSDSSSDTTVARSGGGDGDRVETGSAEAIAASDDAQDSPEPSSPSGQAGSGEENTRTVGSGAGSPVSVTPADLGRDIVFTAGIEVEVDDVAAATQAAVDAVAPLGGLVFGQETTAEPIARTILTIKVRPADFSSALDRLGAVGTLRNQSVSSEDVTHRVVDLQSRIVTAEASVERLRTFLEGAATLEDVASLERELQSRETDLELLRGQLRTIEDAVALATISLTISERQPETPVAAVAIEVSAYVGHDGGVACDSAGIPDVTEHDDVTVCYSVTNVGDLDLVDVVVTDPERHRRDRVVANREPDGPLVAAEVRWFHVEVEAGPERVVSTPRVSAVVAGGTAAAGGNQAGAPTTSASASMELFSQDDDSLPGIASVLGASIGVTLLVLYLIVLVVIAVSPALLVAGLGWVIWRRIRGRSQRDEEAVDAPTPARAE